MVRRNELNVLRVITILVKKLKIRVTSPFNNGNNLLTISTKINWKFYIYLFLNKQDVSSGDKQNKIPKQF